MPDALAALDQLRTDEGWLMASSSSGRFASLFGRDSLIAALQYLPVDPSVADATLERLGRELGAVDDPEREEEPGKVPHEVRDDDLEVYVAHGWPVRHGVLRYYGSVDAGLWFLIVLGALARHGHDVRRHREAGRRVAAWLAGRPQPVAYERLANRGGLAHHWWRDVAADLVERSTHGMFADDGRPMRGPVAAAAVQALAWRALTEAADVLGVAEPHAADRAADAFRSTFLPGPVVAVHGDGDVARLATSDLGIVAWTGVLDDPAPVRERLLEPDLATPHGLRTLSRTHPAFRPDGYHSGSVWPWDSWLGAPSRWPGVTAAVEAIGGFPELYVVEVDGTLRPSGEACAVQAWTAGAVAAISRGWDGRAWV